MKNNKRKFLKTVGLATATSIISGLYPKKVSANKKIKWKMVTSWPKNFPGLGAGAETLANYINELSGGSLIIKVFGAGALVPPLGVFDYVSSGGAEMGHSGAYYWKGKSAAAQFFSSVPFGMTAQEMNSWLYYGGGLNLWEEVYKDFDLVPRPAGNTGVQMGGWFNKEINTTDDLNVVIILDKTSIELFYDNGDIVMTEIFFPQAPYNKLYLYYKGTKTSLKGLKIQEIKK